MMAFRSRWEGRWIFGLFLALGGALGLAGCGGPAKPAGSSRAGRPWKLVIVRFGDTAEVPEPPAKDIRDGLAEGGISDKASYTIEEHDAKGSLEVATQAVEKAAADGADLILAFHPAIARVAAAKAGKVPVVFHMFGDPFALDLGKSNRDHPPGITGAYTPFDRSEILFIARTSFPKAERFGVLFNPDDPESVAHKEALVKSSGTLTPSTPVAVPVEAAEFRSPEEVSAATASLLDKKVAAVFLTVGIGESAAVSIREATAAKVPVLGFTVAQVRGGALIATVPEPRWGGFTVGRQAARVLQGEMAATIPYQSKGTIMETYHNPAVSKAIGAAIRPEILRGAIAIKEPDESP